MYDVGVQILCASHCGHVELLIRVPAGRYHPTGSISTKEWCADCCVMVWVCAGVDCNVVLVGQTGFCRILAHITISLDYDYKYNYNTAADAEPAGSPSVLWGTAPANTPDAKTLPNKVPDWEQLVL